MAWIESHQGLAKHPKTLKLARKLNISIAQVIGHLHLLWWWAMDYAQDGDLTHCDPEDIAIAADWMEDAERFVECLVDVGFVDRLDDGTLKIHDWYDYAGKLIEQREKNNARKKDMRRAYENGTIARVKQRDRDRCRYCGIAVDWSDRKGPLGGTYDHIDPTGPSTDENMVVCCRSCNSKKGGRTPEEARMKLIPIEKQMRIKPASNAHQTNLNHNQNQINTTTTTHTREEESENESRDSFDDLLADDGPIRDKSDPFIQVLDAYCELHRKLDFHVKPKERETIREFLSAGIPARFIVDTMRKMYDAKRQRDEESGVPFQQPTSFTYYTNGLIEAWQAENSGQTAPVPSGTVARVAARTDKPRTPVQPVSHAVPDADETMRYIRQQEELRRQALEERRRRERIAAGADP